MCKVSQSSSLLNQQRQQKQYLKKKKKGRRQPALAQKAKAIAVLQNQVSLTCVAQSIGTQQASSRKAKSKMKASGKLFSCCLL